MISVGQTDYIPADSYTDVDLPFDRHTDGSFHQKQVALYFKDAQLPAEAQIVSAHVRFTSYVADSNEESEDVTMIITAEKSSNPSFPSTSPVSDAEACKEVVFSCAPV